MTPVPIYATLPEGLKNLFAKTRSTKAKTSATTWVSATSNDPAIGANGLTRMRTAIPSLSDTNRIVIILAQFLPRATFQRINT